MTGPHTIATANHKDTRNQVWPFALVAVTGTDAMAFFQRQLTCNLDALAAGEATLGAWCNVKGRVVHMLQIHRHEHGLHLILPQQMAARLATDMAMYVLRDDVQFATPQAQTGPAMGCPNPGAATTSCALPGQPARYLAFSPDGAPSPPRPEQLEHAWQAEIAAGIPWILPASSGRHLPQTLNLDGLGGLVYDKGCYPGQEIVARTHFLGKAKQRLTRGSAAWDPAQPLAVGDPVRDADGRRVGELVLVSQSSQRDADLLFVISEVVLDTAPNALSVNGRSLRVRRGGEPEGSG